MKSKIVCQSCGASNDILLNNCMYCGNSLPTKDPNDLDDEILIENCNTWIGLLNASDKRLGAMIDRNSYYPHAHVIENASIYLGLLEIRALKNKDLMTILSNINLRYQSALKSSENLTEINIKAELEKNKVEQEENKMIPWLVLGSVGLALAIALMMYISK